MSGTAVAIKTKDGLCDARLFRPEGDEKLPVVIYYMDGLGIRPASFDMAARFAQHGYAVLVPNLYYRLGPADKPADPNATMARYETLNNTMIAEDTGAFVAYLDGEPLADASRIGCVGYCMGGGFALTAAGRFPDRVRAAAAPHGAKMATDQPNSPHLLADRMRAKVYVGVAEIDPYLVPGETERLKEAFDRAKVRYQLEIHPGVQHGYAVPGSQVYDRAASERHWERVLALFAETLGGKAN